MLNATVNVSSGVAPRIQNVETVNISGQYAATSLALTNVLGTQTVNLSTGIAGGTATVTDASSINAVNVKAGANVNTLSVTSSAAGTRDTVFVDAGSANSVTVAGNTAADLFDVKLASGASATVNGGTSIDAYTLNVGATASVTGSNDTEQITIGGSAASTVTVTSGSATATAVALDSATGTNQITIQGSNAVTLKGTSAMFDDVRVQDSSSAVSTIWATAISDASVDFTGVEVDVVRLGLDSAPNANSTVNVFEGSSVLLTSDITNTNDVTFGLGATATSATDGAAYSGGTTGTLMLNVAQTQGATAALKTDSNVSTLLITAAPDEASDTANSARITVGKLTLNAATTTTVASGSSDLTVSTLTIGAPSVINAAGMTGRLTIGATSGNFSSTITGGTGNDRITVSVANASAVIGGAGADSITAAGGADTLIGGDGADSITAGSGADTIYGDAGNDTIVGEDGADSIFGGAGNDSITGGNDADTITGGDGADIFVISGASAGADNIRDFVVGTDRIQLTGAIVTGDFDVTNVTVSSTSAYTLGASSPILFGNTATNMANSIQLGTSAVQFTVASGKVVVGGDFADSIGRAAANTQATVTGGGGADTFYIQADGASDANDMTVTDFVVATDKVVLTGISIGDVNLITNVGASGVFDITGATNDIYKFTLTGVANTVAAASIVQLGDSDNAFTLGTGAKYTITSGSFADWITSSANDHTISGGGGADTIVLAAGNETVSFSEGDSTVTAYDQVRGGLTLAASANARDTLDLAGSATVATGLGSTAVGSIASATLSNGIVTFKNAAGANIASSTLVLADAIAFLGANLTGARDTVAFLYRVDVNGNGTFDKNTAPTSASPNDVSTFIYQNGTVDTLIELVGVDEVTGLTTATTPSVATYLVIA